MANPVYSVTDNDLAGLDDVLATQVFVELLRAEEGVRGFPYTRFNVSDRTAVPDGGIDVEVVDEDANVVENDLHKPGVIGYQLKTGTGFNPNDDPDAWSLFRPKGKRRDGTLVGPELRRVLEAGGTLIVVCFGRSFTPQQVSQIESKLTAIARRCAFPSACIKVLGRGHLKSYFERYPALVRRITGRRYDGSEPYANWQKRPGSRPGLVETEKQRACIAEIETALKNAGSPAFVRLWGEPGIGKTRIALEACRAPELSSRVVYYDNAGPFLRSELIGEVTTANNNLSAIIVVDDCDAEATVTIWRRIIGVMTPAVKIVTIGWEDTPGCQDCVVRLRAPELSCDEVAAILQTYGISLRTSYEGREFCGGSPQMAHLLAPVLATPYRPEDIIKPFAEAFIWDRILYGTTPPTATEKAITQAILRRFALFTKVGYKGRFNNEARFVHALLTRGGFGIPFEEFQQRVEDLRRRNILKGRVTLNLATPYIQFKLWVDWWETNGGAFDYNEFVSDMPDNLMHWFHETFIYTPASSAARSVVARLLGPEGLFTDTGLIWTRSGAELFAILTGVDVESAVSCFNRAIRNTTDTPIVVDPHAAWYIRDALQLIAREERLFERATAILETLYDRTNDPLKSMVAKELTAFGSLRFGLTAASPDKRIPFIRSLFESGVSEKVEIALAACNSALDDGPFLKTMPLLIGLKRPPDQWTPQTWDEWFLVVTRVWELLGEEVRKLRDKNRKKGVDIIIDRALRLSRYEPLTRLVIDTINTYIGEGLIENKAALRSINTYLRRYGGDLPPVARERWESLLNALTGTSFETRLRRYVGILVNADFEGGGFMTPSEDLLANLQQLVREVCENLSFLNRELTWLLSGDAENSYHFGLELARADTDKIILALIKDGYRVAGKAADPRLLSGYFLFLLGRDKNEWETELDELAADPVLRNVVADVTWRSGVNNIDDRAAIRVLNLVIAGVRPIEDLSILRFNSEHVSENTIGLYVGGLLNCGDVGAVFIAFDTFYGYYVAAEDKRTAIPEQTAFRLLETELILKEKPGPGGLQSIEYHWGELANAFVVVYPDRELDVADLIVETLRWEDPPYLDSGYGLLPTLGHIAERRPHEVWVRIAPVIAAGSGFDMGPLFEWLKAGGWGLFNASDVWRWVDEDVSSRAPLVAASVPLRLDREEGVVCYPRELIIRYHNVDTVLSNLAHNFRYGESMLGPFSEWFRKKKDEALAFRADETSRVVLSWLDEYIADLEKDIERYVVEEERGDYYS